MMKKQLLTGALALTVLMGSAGMAFAADNSTIAVSKLEADTVNVNAKMMENAAFEPFKISEQKAYTAESYAAELEETKASLKVLVEKNEMTRADADQIIGRMEQDLQKIKNGSLTLYYYDMLGEDGQTVGKISLATDTVDSIQFKEGQEDSMQANMYHVTVRDTVEKPAVELVPAALK